MAHCYYLCKEREDEGDGGSKEQGALILCTAGEVKVGAATAAVIAPAAAACLTHFPLSQVGSPAAGESMCLVPLLPPTAAATAADARHRMAALLSHGHNSG